MVVRAPLSTHPFSGSSLAADGPWIDTYAAAIGVARETGDRSGLDAFLDEWVREVDGEDGYLEKVGIARLRGLFV
jgi:hypothetical protein